MQRFNEKLPVEAVVLTFDFTLALQGAPGTTLIGSPSVSLSSLWGADLNPGALANGSAQLDSTEMKVLVPVIGGLDQNDYLVMVECNTSNPELQLAWPGILPVRQYPSSIGH